MMQEHTGGFIDPEKIISQLPIKPGAIVADFGCGHGYFSLPLAKVVGDNGRILALDVLPSALEAVRSAAKLRNIFNIEIKRCNLENPSGSKLDRSSVDLVFLANILFQSQQKKNIIAEAKRVLKNDGKLVLVEWEPESKMAPQEGWLIEKEKAKRLVEENGFKFEKEFDAGKHHYGALFKKHN